MYRMMYFLNLCARVIGRFSIIIYPYKLSIFIAKCFNLIVSYRLSCMLSKDCTMRLTRPYSIVGHKYIKSCNISYAGPNFRLECIDNYRGFYYNPKVFLGHNLSIGQNCHIGVINKIVIGDNVLMGSNILITDHSHGRNDGSDTNVAPVERGLYSKGPVVIEDNVWICDNVSILPGVIVGRNSIIGANSVVTRNIPPYSIAVGNPARIVREIPH